MTGEDVFAAWREAMVVEQIERRGIRDPRVLEAFRRIPRHEFVPPHCAHVPMMMGRYPSAKDRPFHSLSLWR